MCHAFDMQMPGRKCAYLQQALLRDLGPCLDQVGLQQPRERRHIAWPLPEQRGQQRLENGHVQLRQRRCAQLYQLRKDLEDVGMEFLQFMTSQKLHAIDLLQLYPLEDISWRSK